MSNYVTDPDLLAQLEAGEPAPAPEKKSSGPRATSDGYISDPELLAQLEAGEQAEPGGSMLAPAVAAYGGTPTGFSGQAMKQVIEPLKAAVPETLQVYKSAPWKAGVDLLVGGHGFPPPYASVEGLQAGSKALQAGKESLTEASRLASQFADKADVGKYFDLWNEVKKVNPGAEKVISEIYNTQGGGNAVKNWLTSSPEGQKFLADPKTAQIAEQYIGSLPGKGAQVMKAVSPVLKGAARVAGPAGMAYNLYEAAPYLEKAGPELTSGQAQQRMAQAQQAQLNAPTPAALSPQEAANLLASNDERTINIYGGRQKLQGIASQARPVAPQMPPLAANAVQGAAQPQNWMQQALDMARRYKTINF